jgi:hypothetical protein
MEHEEAKENQTNKQNIQPNNPTIISPTSHDEEMRDASNSRNG